MRADVCILGARMLRVLSLGRWLSSIYTHIYNTEDFNKMSANPLQRLTFDIALCVAAEHLRKHKSHLRKKSRVLSSLYEQQVCKRKATMICQME